MCIRDSADRMVADWYLHWRRVNLDAGRITIQKAFNGLSSLVRNTVNVRPIRSYSLAFEDNDRDRVEMDYRRERFIQGTQQFRHLELVANHLRDLKDDLCSFLRHVVEPPESRGNLYHSLQIVEFASTTDAERLQRISLVELLRTKFLDG